MNQIPKKDWKLLRSMQPEKLNQYCRATLDKIEAEAASDDHDAHESYLNVWKIMQMEDKNIVEMFDDVRRSNALFKLAFWKQHGLLTEKELRCFSEETYGSIEALTMAR